MQTNILPLECCKKVAGTNVVVWGGGVAPRILSVKRMVERERLKDGLRAWLEGKARRVEREEEVRTVRSLVRRFTTVAWRMGEVDVDGRGERRWGKSWRMERSKLCEPTRAKVLGLRKFWEGVARAQEVTG